MNPDETIEMFTNINKQGIIDAYEDTKNREEFADTMLSMVPRYKKNQWYVIYDKMSAENIDASSSIASTQLTDPQTSALNTAHYIGKLINDNRVLKECVQNLSADGLQTRELLKNKDLQISDLTTTLEMHKSTIIKYESENKILKSDLQSATDNLEASREKFDAYKYRENENKCNIMMYAHWIVIIAFILLYVSTL
jgi:hypothetical protein